MTVEIFFLEEEDTPVRRMTPGGWKASTMLEITVRWTRTDRRSFILKKDDNIAIVVRTIIDTVFSFHRERERERVFAGYKQERQEQELGLSNKNLCVKKPDVRVDESSSTYSIVYILQLFLFHRWRSGRAV